ncbi:MAG TPA: M14 family metallopeptidase [Chitinophagaceae bacterium]
MKRLFFCCFCLLALFAQSQVPDPSTFLGYDLGTKFTSHARIVSYFKAVASANPSMVKVEKYGETYEGRELILAFISSAENMKNLEAIRQNNLQAAGLQPGSGVNDKAIVWLSYNVHGNEPSSSEAAMATLWALLDPSNQQAKEWLKNTVVIIDPCLNPDGRDRYVNWYNSVVGKNPNPDPQSREHAEPWPGGRGNHYNFDLNRDWAWQTQQETQQRIAKYNEWMPQVHVDFHEQYYNDPYYFAPAAEPFHEVITPWQRAFQTTIGRNNAAIFDREGWLYFTRQYFDLFYPSYGDTYPTYSGAIGMTYEQAGHSAGGLTVKTDDGDTLTLTDRVRHHTATGLSTIEMSSKNAGRLLSEFRKFFDDSRAGKLDRFKSYVVTAKEFHQLQPLRNLLERNGIVYTYEYGTVNGKGYNYFTGKNETFSSMPHSIVISSFQPRSALMKVLMEPVNKLSDTATYDITAWSLPYAFGLQAWASETPVKAGATDIDFMRPDFSKAYGFIVPYNGLMSAQTLAALLKKGVKVRVTEKPVTYAGTVYGSGSLLVVRSSNQALWPTVSELIPAEAGATAIETGFMESGPDIGSADIRVLKAPRVAMVTGQGVSSTSAGEVWHFMEQSLDYPVSLINATDISNTDLGEYDVVILPSGNYRFLSDKSGGDRLKEFVRNGGRLVAMGNTVSQMAQNDWGVKAREEKKDENNDKPDYRNLRRYADRERDDLVNAIPGAIYKVDLDETHPLAFGYGKQYYTLKMDTDVFEFLKDGWNVGYIRKENYVTGFAGNNAKNRLKDGLVFGVQPMGRGSVIYMADDPLFRRFWQHGELLFANAVFMVN